jgi:hypothetical protein
MFRSLDGSFATFAQGAFLLIVMFISLFFLTYYSPQWQHSLVCLDLSWCKGHWRLVESAFDQLLLPHVSFRCLRSLNISGTNITGRTLRFFNQPMQLMLNEYFSVCIFSRLLECCPKLTELILIGCQSIPSAWCRHFTREEFQKLAFS